MYHFLWVIVILLFTASLIAVIIPFIPEMILLWSGFLLAHFTLSLNIPAYFWWVMIFISAFIISADLISNIVFVKKYGGSKWAMISAVVGVIPGITFLGPFGVFIGPFIMVYLVGLIEGKDNTVALKNALGVLIGFFSSTLIKIILQLAVIIWFFVLL